MLVDLFDTYYYSFNCYSLILSVVSRDGFVGELKYPIRQGEVFSHLIFVLDSLILSVVGRSSLVNAIRSALLRNSPRFASPRSDDRLTVILSDHGRGTLVNAIRFATLRFTSASSISTQHRPRVRVRIQHDPSTAHQYIPQDTSTIHRKTY